MPTSKQDLDKIADDYHSADTMQDKHIEDICQEHTYDWVLKNIGRARSILEMGYGEGNFTAVLSKLPARLTVVEGSPQLVKKAQGIYGTKIRFECQLFESFTPTECYDAIVATHVLEHVDDPVALLRLMKKWLNPRGRIIILVPNKESLHRQLAVLMGLQPALDTLGARDHLVGHQRVYSLAALAADVRRAGLRVTKQEGFFLKMLPNSMMLGFSPELLKALNKISSQLPDHLLGNIGLVANRK
jgi:2-polyprenyl-3-methyl-5-hydroxy-6-metoxy-1,4-benzoquinol methylase